MFYIYGRFGGSHGVQKKFRAMNLRDGVQVNKLIFASRLTEADVEKFMRLEAPRNAPDWEFKPVPIVMSKDRQAGLARQIMQ